MAETVRDMVKQIQREVRETPDLAPDRASEILNELCSLVGNVNDEIREADTAYALVRLECFKVEPKANRASLIAETTPAYSRKREARDTKELVLQMIGALKYQLRSKQEEMRLAR